VRVSHFASSSVSALWLRWQVSAALDQYLQLLHILLEIVHSCLAPRVLRHNLHLVYTLLHRRDVLTPLQTDVRFSSLVDGVNQVRGSDSVTVTGAASPVSWRSMTRACICDVSVLQLASLHVPSESRWTCPVGLWLVACGLWLVACCLWFVIADFTTVLYAILRCLTTSRHR
jgi:hypothetical protein